MLLTLYVLQVRLSAFKWLLMAINVTENHWVLLAANVPMQTVSIVDSLSFRSADKYLNKWRLCTEHLIKLFQFPVANSKL